MAVAAAIVAASAVAGVAGSPPGSRPRSASVSPSALAGRFGLSAGPRWLVPYETQLSLDASELPPGWREHRANPEVPAADLLRLGGRSAAQRSFVRCAAAAAHGVTGAGAGSTSGSGGTLGYHTSPNFFTPPPGPQAQASSVVSVQRRASDVATALGAAAAPAYMRCLARDLAATVDSFPTSPAPAARGENRGGARAPVAHAVTRVTSTSRLAISPGVPGVAATGGQYGLVIGFDGGITVDDTVALVLLGRGRTLVSLFFSGFGQPFPGAVMDHVISSEAARLAATAPPSRPAPGGQGSLRALAAFVTCGGCPPAERGARLVRDVAIARAVNLSASAPPPGWVPESRTAPRASVDRPYGVADRTAALGFATCMHLSADQRRAILDNADQVMNLGSPYFVPAGTRGSPRATLDSWVDMTRNTGDARAEWASGASARYPSCAAPLFAALISVAGGLAASISAGAARTGRSAAGRLAATVRRYPLVIASQVRSSLIEVQFTGALSLTLWVASVGVGRLQESVVLTVVDPAAVENPRALVGSLATAAGRAAAAFGRRLGGSAP